MARRHTHFGGPLNTRVLRAVDFLRLDVGDAEAVGVKKWASGLDAAGALYPRSSPYWVKVASLIPLLRQTSATVGPGRG